MTSLVERALNTPHRFKLGIFSANADGGLAFTKVPERWTADWDDTLAAAQIADQAGIDYFLPIARWRGYGGETHVRERSFETFTWAAGLGAMTRQMTIFMTVHVPLVHPLYAAKALATVDHISHGRAGLNIVCGWNPDEFAMFGTELVAEPYARAAEWIDILQRLYEADEPIDYNGTYYHLKGAVSRPAALQKPRPVTMSAASGAAGRDFAVRNCDYLFTSFGLLEDADKHVKDVGERAAAVGRTSPLQTIGHVVCRDSGDEAQAYYHRYAVEEADTAAVDYHVSQKMKFSGEHRELEQYRQRFAGGTGSLPLVGTPEQVADLLVQVHRLGYAGMALSFVNYRNELPFFCERVLPLLKEAGLRC